MKFKNLKERKGNKNPSLELAKCNRRLFEREREEGRRKGEKIPVAQTFRNYTSQTGFPPDPHPFHAPTLDNNSYRVPTTPLAFITLPFLPSFLSSPAKCENWKKHKKHAHTHTHTSLCGMSKGDERRKRKPRGFCVHRCSYAKTTVRLRPFQPSLSLRPSLSLSLSLSFPPLRRFSRSSVATTRRVPTVLKLDGGFFHDD